MKTVNVLGATGSIGESTLSIIRAHPDLFKVGVVTAHQNVDKLSEIAKEFDAEIAVIVDESKYQDLKGALSGSKTKILAGEEGLLEASSYKADITMAAITGMAGLKPTLSAIEQGNIVAFASKEALVSAGKFMMDKVKECGTTFLPVDSEHNAIYQVLEAKQGVKRIVLTASGGPFRESLLREMERVTPKQAVAHPNWSMGAKISVDSATMMNKGLELIEASYLFDMPEDKIDIVVHPQSIIHSMVEYIDGSILAQMGAPDMCTPISYCLGHPKRIETPGKTLNWSTLNNLDFEEADTDKFPCLNFARKALNDGYASCIALNASNEIAVDAFLNENIGFMDIVRMNEDILLNFSSNEPNSIEDVIAIDAEVRNVTKNKINTLSKTALKA